MKNFSTLKIVMLFIKGVTGTIGVSLIFSQKYPVITVIVLAVGAGTVEVMTLINSINEKEKEDEEIS